MKPPAPSLANQHNKALAEIFRQMAACYKYLGQEERFRAIAYDNAARTIESMKDDIALHAHNVKELDELKGIGESIAEKIIEWLSTGRIKTFEKLKKEVPLELLDLMEINGMGPSTLKTLHENLGINSREDLLLAIEKGKLSTLKGFGEKKIANIQRALKLYKETGTRLLLWDAMQVGENILADVKKIKGVIKAELAGSLRRKKETIGDIDIIVAASPAAGKSITKKFSALPQVERIIAAGDTKASVVLRESGTQVDIRVVDPSEYGAAMLYFTGSKEHNIHLRVMAKERGWKINEYGLYDDRERQDAGKHKTRGGKDAQESGHRGRSPGKQKRECIRRWGFPGFRRN